MLKLFTLLFLVSVINAFAQDTEKTVTLVVCGQGKTQDEAKQNALRSAIEQAFGAYISSKTEILNDNLVKDEIVSVTNGNIQKFDVLSQVQIPDGGYATTLKAVVSVSKLTSFCESKGVIVEFKGGLFAMNIKLQKINEDAEFKAVLNLCEVSKEILSKGIDYSLEVSEPIANEGSSSDYLVDMKVICTPNKNLDAFYSYFWTTISKIALTEFDDEKSDYDKLQKPLDFIFKGQRLLDRSAYGEIQNEFIEIFYFRNQNSTTALKNLMITSNFLLMNFRVTSEVDTIIVTRGEQSNFGYYNKYKENNKWYLEKEKESYPFSVLYQCCHPPYRRVPVTRSTIEYAPFSDFEYILISSIKSSKLVVSSNPQPVQIVLLYSNLLTLNQIEKISKYKIEPWENKTFLK